MALSLIKIVKKDLPLKAISLILGYVCWSIISYHHSINLKTTVPLSFYNIPDHLAIKSSDTITITLTGPRSQLQAIDLTHLAVHINAEYIRPGSLPISITTDTLFLPKNIKLVDYKPAPLTIEVTQS
jgi:hypothetical protein